MIPLRTIPPLNKLDTISNNAGIVLHLDAELNHMILHIFFNQQVRCSVKSNFSSLSVLRENLKIISKILGYGMEFCHYKFSKKIRIPAAKIAKSCSENLH